MNWARLREAAAVHPAMGATSPHAWLKAARKMAAGARLANVLETVLMYHRHADNISANSLRREQDRTLMHYYSKPLQQALGGKADRAK